MGNGAHERSVGQSQAKIKQPMQNGKKFENKK